MMKARGADKQALLQDNDFMDQDYVAFTEPSPQSLTLTEDRLRSPTTQEPSGVSNYGPSFSGGASNYPHNDSTVVSVNPYTTHVHKEESLTYRAKNFFLTMMQPGGTEDYLPWSIINTLCCCVLFGLLAIICSVKSKNAREKGDKVSARWHSLSAYRLNIIATALGFVILLTMYVMYVATDWLDQENGYLFKLPRRLKQSAAKKQ